MIGKRPHPGRITAKLVMLFYFSAFLLLALKDLQWQGFALAVAVPSMIWIGTYVWHKLFPVDRLLLSLVNFLCALGILVLYTTKPAYAYQQVMYYGVGLFAMLVCIYLIRLIHHWKAIAFLLIPLSLALLALPLIIGKETNGARNWITISGLSLQPSEVVKLSLVLILAYFMSRRQMLPWLLFAGACLLLLMLQKDLGTALMYYGTTLMLFYASSGSLVLTAIGLGGGAGAAVMGYQMFAHVKKRVAIWRNPWSDYNNAGYQLVQGLIAIASGGLFGVGLGLGYPTIIPVFESDFIFAVICEQFGVLFGLCVLLMYVALLWRGATIAMAARRSFHGLVAMGCTALLGLQTFTIIGGVMKLIPLTGVTLPFVSYGGTSLVSSMCLMGFLQGVSSINADALHEDTQLGFMAGEEDSA